MSGTKNLAELGKLIAVHHGWAAAKACKACEMDDADRAKLSLAALQILKAFPAQSDDHAALNAAFAVRIEQVLQAPVQLVAGVLTVERQPIFGRQSNPPIKAFPADAAGSFDGHIWMMVGPYIADISIFRMAYSRGGPAELSRHIALIFGPNKGLYVDHWGHTRKMGLGYEPQYVLSSAEVDRLMATAFDLIQNHQNGDPLIGS